MKDPASAVRYALARLDEVQRPDVWITLRRSEDLIAEAEEVTRRAEAGEDLPLAGLTFAVKDNIDVADLPTTAGHPEFSRTPERHAPVVERLLGAGAVLLGKTNLDQFATGLVGTRSPYGEVASAVDSTRVGGGSSSGSALAVALGIVDFSLGTDTAGSGRVPAAFNGIVGLKPTLGALPLTGVVPACPSYDTVSIFAPDVALAASVMNIVAVRCPEDAHGRDWPETVPLSAPAAPVIGVPRDEDLRALSEGAREVFAQTADRVRKLGMGTREVDLRPALEAAQLLYHGGLVAERAYAFGDFIAAHPEQADPSVRSIVEQAAQVSGPQVIRDQQRLLELKRELRESFQEVDALIMPTAPNHPTLEAVRQDPLTTNSFLGIYTNFVNLFDLSALAVPVGEVPGEGLFGVSFLGQAFHDQVLLDLSARFLGMPQPPQAVEAGIDLAVFGAHMRDEPLNSQLLGFGARYVRDIETTPRYRMHLIEGATPRPGVVQGDGGVAMPGELWRIPATGLTSLLTALPAPMALGPVELSGGKTVTGFTAGLSGEEPDITGSCGWRGYLRETAAGSR
ncbi:allophanate hydrolase [Nesterenkonia populi]|uniref:allophanate hydrolase n=1 Tax=Nesterenkonia populi TaxID=1591087 RepID=UPI0011BDAAFE|nr:allophanate hydrolase [Nesterenkonia populi]